MNGQTNTPALPERLVIHPSSDGLTLFGYPGGPVGATPIRTVDGSEEGLPIEQEMVRRWNLFSVLSRVAEEHLSYYACAPDLSDCDCDDFVFYVPLKDEAPTCLHVQARQAIAANPRRALEAAGGA